MYQILIRIRLTPVGCPHWNAAAADPHKRHWDLFLNHLLPTAASHIQHIYTTRPCIFSGDQKFMSRDNSIAASHLSCLRIIQNGRYIKKEKGKNNAMYVLTCSMEVLRSCNKISKQRMGGTAWLEEGTHFLRTKIYIKPDAAERNINSGS